jgi:hypothetical protein
MAELNEKLLNLLVCPLTKKSLRYDKDAQELVSVDAGIAYPIRSGIPIMLIDEARIIDSEKAAKFQLFANTSSVSDK